MNGPRLLFALTALNVGVLLLGVVLVSAKGPVPRLTEAIFGAWLVNGKATAR
jgi:hypothetical protein